MANTHETGNITSELDLVLTRVVDVPVALLWKAWSNPEHVKQWWAPRPWMTPVCEIDLRQGGHFHTIMRGPEGQELDNTGCFLEVVPQQKIIFTDTLGVNYRPSRNPSCEAPYMTAIITMEDLGDKTRYTVTVLHKDEDDRSNHEKLGFFDGWGTVLTQLTEYAKELGSRRP